MCNKDKIDVLKKYKEVLIYATGYKIEKEKEQMMKEKKEPQKVLVLRKKWYDTYKRVV